MERKLFQAFVALAWLALPLTALKYWSVWDRLPMRIAVHFDINWQPNGWTSREGARLLALGTTTFLLAIFTIASFAAVGMSASSLSRWSMLAVFYLVLGLLYYVNMWIVDRSMSTRRASPTEDLIACRDLEAAARFRG
jgi:Protein of unknown function (DUF1648)